MSHTKKNTKKKNLYLYQSISQNPCLLKLPIVERSQSTDFISPTLLQTENWGKCLPTKLATITKPSADASAQMSPQISICTNATYHPARCLV